MNIPDFAAKPRTEYERWTPVVAGKQEPDEYQRAMIELTQAALDAGLFYNTDVKAHVREHCTFIPDELWTLQFNQPVEGGVVGMEVFYARDYIREKGYREADALALHGLNAGDILGTLHVNHKRIFKCKIDRIEGATVYFSGMAGSYPCTFSTQARHVAGMITKAEARGWRKTKVPA